MWAAGVILYILLCGFPPFSSPDGDQEKLFDAILSARLEFPAPHWERVSAGAIDLVANMLRPQPELRFAAEDVLDHAWMSVSLLSHLLIIKKKKTKSFYFGTLNYTCSCFFLLVMLKKIL